MASYIAEVQETLRQFIQDLKDGVFDVEDEDGQELIDTEAVQDDLLEQTLRDYNDAVCEIGY